MSGSSPFEAPFSAAVREALDGGSPAPIPAGRTVICDCCGEDMTDDPRPGGFTFGGFGGTWAAGPCCARREEARLRVSGTPVTGRCPGRVPFADWMETARAITSGYGRNGAFLMVTALADWTVAAQCQAGGREMPGKGSPGRPAWRDPDSGTLTLDAREVSPAAAWGGQFLTARAAMDHGMTRALFESMPDQCGEHVRLLVATCAESVKLARSAS